MGEAVKLNGTATAALDYWRQGWTPIPMPRGTKKPGDGWNALRLDEDTIPEAFAAGENVGVILGEPSGGLVDVDLDCDEAVALAPAILPRTDRVHGRGRRPRSHFWYVSPGARKVDFKAPGNVTLVELRADGEDGGRHQTVVPPSIHPEGDSLSWEAVGEPAHVPATDLRRAVARLAAASLLARTWPREGGRDDAALAVCGMLIRAGWAPDDVDAFVQAVARAARDDEWRNRGKGAATAKRHAAGDKVRGLPAVSTAFGKDVAERIATWLEIGKQDEHRSAIAPRWHTFTEEELVADPPRQVFVWDGALPLRKAGVLAGGGGGGKTSLLVGLAVHRAIGAKYLGRYVRQGATVVLTTEDDLDDYRRKLAAWRDYLPGLDLQAVARNIHLVDLAGVPFRLVERVRGGSYAVTPDVEAFAKLVKERAPNADLIVLETVSRLGGDESNEAMSMLIVAAEQLAAATDATVLLVTHVSQNAARERISDAYAPRGGSAISDNARFVLVLSTLDPEAAPELAGEDVDPATMKRLVVLSVPKINGAPPQEPTVLERLPVPPGIVLRPYQGRTSPATPEERRERLGERLRQVVAEARAGGMTVTLHRLQDDLRGRLRLSRRAVVPAVLDAVADGYLVRGPVARGGGDTYLESVG